MEEIIEKLGLQQEEGLVKIEDMQETLKAKSFDPILVEELLKGHSDGLGKDILMEGSSESNPGEV